MDRAAERRRMVARLEEDGVVRDARVAATMQRVPREAFLPPDRASQAFVDSPIGIGEGQTISAPHMVAIMLEALDLAPGQRVLEIGAGSGYHAACMADLVGPEGRIVAVERIPALARAARRNLDAAGYARVGVVLADGSRGVGRGTFDRVSVAAAAPRVPPALLEALVAGGVLLAPVGDREGQTLVRVRKRADGTVERDDLGAVRFVPLVGREGFPG